MKRAICLLIMIIIFFCFAGCGTTIKNKNATPATLPTEGPDTIEGLVTYVKADFDKYNSHASENGLDGDMIYVEGKLSGIISLGDSYCATLTDINNNKWLFAVGSGDSLFDIEKARVIEHKNVIAMGVYSGYSDVFNMPSFVFSEIKIIDTGEEYYNFDFILDTSPEPGSTPNNDIVLYDQNGIKITYIDVSVDDDEMNIKLFIENNTDLDRSFYVEDFSINGIMLDPFMYEDINSGKKAYAEITLSESELEDLGGDEARYCEFKIRSYPANFDDWSDKITTDLLKIDFVIQE